MLLPAALLPAEFVLTDLQSPVDVNKISSSFPSAVSPLLPFACYCACPRGGGRGRGGGASRWLGVDDCVFVVTSGFTCAVTGSGNCLK